MAGIRPGGDPPRRRVYRPKPAPSKYEKYGDKAGQGAIDFPAGRPLGKYDPANKMRRIMPAPPPRREKVSQGEPPREPASKQPYSPERVADRLNRTQPASHNQLYQADDTTSDKKIKQIDRYGPKAGTNDLEIHAEDVKAKSIWDVIDRPKDPKAGGEGRDPGSAPLKSKPVDHPSPTGRTPGFTPPAIPARTPSLKGGRKLPVVFKTGAGGRLARTPGFTLDRPGPVVAIHKPVKERLRGGSVRVS